MANLRGEQDGLHSRVRWDERDLAVHHVCRPHELPGRILARAFPCCCFATARARGKFHVVWQRPLDAAAFGTIQTVEMINLTRFMHASLLTTC